MTDRPLQPPHLPIPAAEFDLPYLRARALQHRLNDDELTALTGIPTTDWDTSLTPQNLTGAAMITLAHALNTPPESLLRQPGTVRPRHSPQLTPHAAVLHAALIETGPIHPDDLASALEWDSTRLTRAATALKAHLHQANSSQRLVRTETAIHLAAALDLLTPRQLDNLRHTGHSNAALSPSEATAAARLLHRTVLGLALDVEAAQIPRLANRRLLAPTGPPAPHPDLLFALGLTASPMTAPLPEPAPAVLADVQTAPAPRTMSAVRLPALPLAARSDR